MKSQRAYAEHVLHSIGGIAAVSALGRDAVLGSHIPQDVIIRNLRVICESVRRTDSADRVPYVEIYWKAIARMLSILSGMDPEG